MNSVLDPQALPVSQRRWTLAGTISKYLSIFRIALSERLAYRVDFLLGTIFRFVPLAAAVVLWEAVYNSIPADETMGGFTREQMIAYLLLVYVSRTVSSMPGLALGIAGDIREGNIKKYLIQPLHLIAYLLAYRAAQKTGQLVTAALPYAVLFLIFSPYFEGFPDLLTFAAYLVALLLSFAVGFFLDTCVGLLGFWFLDITSLLWILTTLTIFISGQMAPLDLLPGWAATLLKALPFQYLAYFPAVIFLGKLQGMALLEGLLLELAWAVGSSLLALWLYGRGLRHYSAFGG
jgi:ABC-2 type transport system permease protein